MERALSFHSRTKEGRCGKKKECWHHPRWLIFFTSPRRHYSLAKRERMGRDQRGMCVVREKMLFCGGGFDVYRDDVSITHHGGPFSKFL